MKGKNFFFLLFVMWFFSRCFPAPEEVLTDVNFDLSKTEFQRFYDLQDQQLVDSLIPKFKHKDPSYRYAAAMAFASIQDSVAIDSLANLLKDPVEDVRLAAAYAIGQIGSGLGEKHLINAFQSNDPQGLHNKFNGAILEALGKCGSMETLKYLSTITTYKNRDTALLEGQAWGIYRFALQGKVIPDGTKRMMHLLEGKTYPESVRFIAANYLGRAKKIKLEDFANSIARELLIEKDPRVRMALVLALGKTKMPKALDALNELYAKETDYRVKCNIINTVGNFEYIAALPLVTKGLKDPNDQIAQTAASFFVNYGIGQAAPQYRRMARTDTALNWQVQTTLYKAANRHLSLYSANTRSAIQYELRDRFVYAKNIYEKAEVLRALGEFGRNYKVIYDLAFASPKPVLRTASIEALAKIWKNPQFDEVLGFSRNRAKQEIAGYFKEAMEKGDPAMIAVAAEAIRESPIDIKTVFDTLTFLDAAQKGLVIPKETETYYELQKTIDFLNGKKTELTKPVFNHPIDWRKFNTIKEDTKAEIKTSKGSFVIQFFPKIAPGTVTNFVALVNSGLYNDRAFHRVVPNFVIQDGCPRGDGYGSAEHTIRSELMPMYYDREGFVGMAHSGNHTESMQWFVTHSPAPHLDGKYTIFAKVVDGMDVVHKITLGDKVQQIQIVN